MLKRIITLFAFLLWAVPGWAQIAFDAAADGGNNGGSTSSLSWSHTSTGSNRIGFVGCQGDTMDGADDVTSITWGGSGMTLVRKITTSDFTPTLFPRFLYLYYIIAPATGSQTVQANISGTHYLLCGSVSYTGASQTGQTDADTANESALATDTSLTTMLTTVADNSWVLVLEEGYNADNPPGAGTGSTRRTFEAAFGGWGLFDSNGPKTPAGSVSMETTRTSAAATGIQHIMASFKPAAAAGGGGDASRMRFRQ